MSLIDQLLGSLGLEQLFQFILKKFPTIGKLLNLGQKVIEHFTGTFDAGLRLWNSVTSEIDAFKHFREDFRLKSRVVNIERAITKTRELVQGIFDSYRAVLDLFKNLTTKAELGGAAEI